jgi:two-component system response regulator EvgA
MNIENKFKNVLVVENSEEFSSWIESEFENISNLRIAAKVNSVQDGYRFLKRQTPNIVVLDLVLSDGSGIKLLKKIREMELPIKVIVFTNYNFYRKECLKHGSDYFFDKSNEFEEFIETIKLLCN